MFPAAFDYRAPTSLDEALSILAQHGDAAKVLAGGQSLIPLLKLRFSRPEMLVDIARYFEFVKKPERTGIRHVAPRQLLRLTAIVVAVLAGLHRTSELTAALVLLLLVLAYMRLTAWAREQ